MKSLRTVRDKMRHCTPISCFDLFVNTDQNYIGTMISDNHGNRQLFVCFGIFFLSKMIVLTFYCHSNQTDCQRITVYLKSIPSCRGDDLSFVTERIKRVVLHLALVLFDHKENRLPPSETVFVKSLACLPCGELLLERCAVLSCRKVGLRACGYGQSVSTFACHRLL